MSSDLYGVLELSSDATVEQIRKAYKKKALQTHPDRLPPGSTSEDKKAADEAFRQIKVNHAYEILTDPEKRKEYDLHGTWPPPEPEEDNFDTFFDGGFPGRRHGQRSHTFPNSSGHHRHHRHHHPSSGFVFRDPFELFESIFRDFDDDDFFNPSHMHPFTPLSPFGGMRGPRAHSLFNNSFFGPTFTPGIMFESAFESNRRRSGNCTSESYVSTTINGATQTVHTRRDSEGNEHITRTYSDGREVYTINGIEQPSRGSLPQSTPEPRVLPQPSSSHYLPPVNPQSRSYTAPQQRRPSRSGPQHPMPPYSQSRNTLNHNGGYNALPPAQQSTQFNMMPQREYDAPPPPYLGNNNVYRDHYDRHNPASAADHQRHRERRATEQYVSTNHRETDLSADRHNKRWLPRGFGRH